jgi:hypothetical protein
MNKISQLIIAVVFIIGLANNSLAMSANGGGSGGGGGSTSPGGSSGQLQYNNAGAFGGTSGGGDCTFAGPSTFTCTKTNGVSFAPSATTDTTNASNITSGTLAAANGGAGTITGALKGNGSGVVTHAACADLSNGASGCSTTVGALATLGVGTSLASSGGNLNVNIPGGTLATHNFANALSATGTLTGAQPSCSDLSNGAASCSTDTTNASNITSGTLAAARGGAGAITGILKANGSGTVSQAVSGTDYQAAIAGNTLATHNFTNSISSAGTISGAQPAFTDISGTASNAQIPTPTISALGGVEAQSGATTNNFVTYINTSGIPQIAQPSFSNLSGSATAAQLPLASASAVGGVQGDNSTITINGSGVESCTTATSSQIGCAKFGTGLAVTAGNVTNNETTNYIWNPTGTGVSTTVLWNVYLAVSTITIQNGTGTFGTLTACAAGGETIKFWDCGTSAPTAATSCTGGTALVTFTTGTTTNDAAGVTATINNATITVGHYLAYVVNAANSCTSVGGMLNVAAQ